MTKQTNRIACLAACLLTFAFAQALPAFENDGTSPDVTRRFADPDVEEIPDFQRHVAPLFGRMGCNARSCHGSFQGRGGFQLSLFGYDFMADHKAVLDGRVDLNDPEDSLILAKPTDGDDHGGGLRFEENAWQYNLLKKWIENEAPIEETARIERLEISPPEILAVEGLESVQLKVVAHWSNGDREDVTPICRFKSNDTQISNVDADGKVTFDRPGDSHVIVSYDKSVVPVPVVRPVGPQFGQNYPAVETPTRVDELTAQKWRKLGLVPSELAGDEAFLRRVKLDLTGTLPNPDEIRKFMADSRENKRQIKIDELLETPAYSAWWATRLCDITGNNTRQLQNTTPDINQASRQWYDWIRQRVEDNVPYVDIVEGIVLAKSREEDESFRDYCKRMSDICRDKDTSRFVELDSMPFYWMRRDFRDPAAKAISFAHTFLGIRIQCAQCHKHPFDQWDKNDFKEFSQFFAGINVSRNGSTPEDRKDMQAILKDLGVERLNGQARRNVNSQFRKGATIPFAQLSVTRPRPVLSEEEKKNRKNRNNRRRNRGRDRSIYASVLGGEKVDVSKMGDPRTVVMDWLRDPENHFLARAFVNRVWANYFNVGIVDPPDDLNLANPPSNAALLEYLTEGFIEHNYDMKWLHREIANSRTYQLSWKPNETNLADQRNFSRSVPRRLPAEQVFDALSLATSNDQLISTFDTDMKNRAIAIPGTRQNRRINGRDLLNVYYALNVFGRSARSSSCDCDRSSSTSLLQTVYLQNDRDIHYLIDREKTGWIDQLEKEFGIDKPTIDKKRLERVQNNLRNMRRQVKQLEKKGNDKQAAKIRKNIAKFQERFQKELASLKKSKSAVEKTPDLERLVESAYLRTLSRYPSEQEMSKCIGFIENDDRWIDGLRGVFWALLNTKEFIVNH
ncbi:DUF1553 domain-containing protein [Vicingaceae bacterium]|nr:DUF1553 domain-containing protein [Vicingaceae bacterium]